MQSPEPTMLHRPEGPIQAQPAAPVALGWLMAALPIVAVGVWLGLRRSRYARSHPREHAFQALARRMGLAQREIHAVRAYARSTGLHSPIAVLMDPARLDAALGSG